MSDKEPPFQNIPLRTWEGHHIREAFPRRHTLDLDYSNIEFRILKKRGKGGSPISMVWGLGMRAKIRPVTLEKVIRRVRRISANSIEASNECWRMVRDHHFVGPAGFTDQPAPAHQIRSQIRLNLGKEQ